MKEEKTKEEKTKEMIDSDCFGEWEKKEIICNGDKTSKSREERRACAWMVRCKAFTEYIESVEKKPLDFFVRELDEDGDFVLIPKIGMKKFKEFCDDLVKKERESIKRKKKKSVQFDKDRDGRWAGPTQIAKKASAKVKKEKAKNRRKVLLKILNEFRLTLDSLLENNSFTVPGEVIRTGQLYFVNYMNTSGYISVYCKVTTGKKIPVVSFIIKPSTLTFDVKLPFTVEELQEYCSKSDIKVLNPVSIDIGSFKSIANRLDQEKMILLAEVIAKLVSSGKMVFPVVS